MKGIEPRSNPRPISHTDQRASNSTPDECAMCFFNSLPFVAVTVISFPINNLKPLKVGFAQKPKNGRE